MSNVVEYFDVVDQNDILTGDKITKTDAHANHIIHRCVAVYVFDRAGNLYVQDHQSGFLDHTVGGHVSAGEDYANAAKREAEEEVGLYNQIITPVYLSFDSDEVFNPLKQKQRIYHKFGIFESYPNELWKFVPNQEVSRIFPMSLNEIAKGMQSNPTRYTPGFINTLAKYIEVKKLNIPFDLDFCKKNWGEL